MRESDLREVLEKLAERGEPRGANAVVSAALAQASDHRLVEPAQERQRPRHRALVRRVALAAAAAAVVVAAAGAGGALYLREKLDDVGTVDLHAALADRGAAGPSEPMTVLLVGSDGRDGVDGVRADTIMVLRLDPAADRAALLSIPRDLWVPIAGQGREQRVNTALAEGPEVLVRTVSDLLDAPIDHYVEVGFDGFRDLVDVLGGVEVAFPAPIRDEGSGLHIDQAGCVRLDGAQALALVRSRHLQHLTAGEWRIDATGDLGRIRRQQDFLLQVVRRVAAASNPLTLNRLIDVAVDHVTIDAALSGRDLVDLARTVREIDVVTFDVVPTTATVVGGGAAVLTTDDAAIAAAVRRLLTAEPQPPEGDAPAPAPPSPAASC